MFDVLNRLAKVLVTTGFILHLSQEVFCEEMSKTVNFEEVYEHSRNNQTLIIDVREPHEVEEFGKIPNSINIPLGSVESDINYSEAEFFQNYGRPKPNKDDLIIVYCRSGRRSSDAQNKLEAMGFTHVKNYLGSYNDWIEHTRGTAP